MIRAVMGSLGRRWYITLPGLLFAGLLTVGAWYVVPSSYQRSASEFLVPGSGSLPENANPFLYLSGLSQAADVLVKAVGSDNVASEIQRSYPGAVIQVSRDPSTAGPVILITVDARSDADAAQILDILLKRTRTELEDLQAGYSVPSSQRITVRTLTVDQQGTVRPRTRMLATGGILAASAILAIFMAVLVDGLANRQQPSRHADAAHDETGAPVQPTSAASGAETSDLPDSDDPATMRPTRESG
jgi:hypothetical protein